MPLGTIAKLCLSGQSGQELLPASAQSKGYSIQSREKISIETTMHLLRAAKNKNGSIIM